MLNRREFIRNIGLGAATAGAGLGLAATGAAAKEVVGKGSWAQPWAPEAPRRLSDLTRELAARALSGEHGRSVEPAPYALPESASHLPRVRQYGVAAKTVAKKTPLRVLPGEQIIGSATTLEGALHQAPLMDLSSTSHTTLGFDRILCIGYKGLRKEIEDKLARGGFAPCLWKKSETEAEREARGRDLLLSMLDCLDAAAIWHQRHMDLLDECIATSEGEVRQNYIAVRETLRNVPENPPRNFREAVQSLWFTYSFQRLMGTWSGIGRIDEMLGCYLEEDLKAKRITMDEARELIAHFWIKGCEWVGIVQHPSTGDAQYYQNIILAGVDEHGREVTNDVTYLVLDVVEELRISDFPIAVRLNKHTPRRLMRRMAEVQRHGGGIVAMYNEEVVIEGLVKFGYPLEEARRFTNDGCWECLIPGKTAFIYVPFDCLALLNDVLGLSNADAKAPQFTSFEALFTAFEQRLDAHLEVMNAHVDNSWNSDCPAPLVSMFVEGCIERGLGYYERGAQYSVLSPHAGRLANVANSLAVIKKLVYEEQYLTLPEFVEILRNDWDGQEPLRRLVHKRFRFYGNDDSEADAMMERVFNCYTGIVAKVPERNGVLRPCGISTFGREIEWSMDPNGGQATADGHHAGAILATNFSPSPGTDLKGPTAVLQSYCKMDFTRTPNGATVELKLHPESVRGDKGVDDMVALMRAFQKMGGMFLHIDVVDSAMLLDAQRHPEKYPNLSVRIAGWSARFATLDRNWQNMVIQRTQHYA